jgi:putative ABC transport system permease protein
MSVPLARRQLLAHPGRTAAGIAGIAVALLLVLALRGIFAGVEQRLTAYIDRSGADVIVAQHGVDSMHMTESSLRMRDVAAIRRVPGVARATPILYAPTLLDGVARTSVVYLIGEPRRRLPPGGIVVDASLGARIGERVRALGRSFRVTGTESGTASIASSVAIVRYDDLGRRLHRLRLPSYVLVRAAAGVDAGALAQRIDRRLPTVTASTRSAFARSERSTVGDMTTDLIRAMTLVAFGVGIGVAGLVAYTAVLAQLPELVTLRALGLRPAAALGVVAREVTALVAAGFAAALAITFGLEVLLPRLSPTLAVAVRPRDVVTTAVVAAAVAALAVLYPVLRVARLEPAAAFRR